MNSHSQADQMPRVQKWQRAGWMTLGATGVAAVLFFIVIPPRAEAVAKLPPASVQSGPQAVSVEENGMIQISEDTPFAERISTVRLVTKSITDPLLTVSGIVVAKVLSGEGELADRWHFDSPELATAHANWQKSINEIQFSRSILEKTQELAKVQESFLTEQLQRIEPTAKSGVIPERELKSARADLLKAQIQGQRDIFSAQSAVRIAENNRIALERELSQRGIEPLVFNRGVDGMVLISANVPETKVSQVREGQACRARFYAYPDRVFDGHVETLSTTVTKELRTLRVLFDLHDPDGRLIPGMFAEVELGTDQRDTLVIPGEAVLHVNQADYVLVNESAGRWRPQEIEIGKFRQGAYEVLKGLSEGQTIISEGAVLLKPKLVESLSRQKSK